MGLLDTSGSQEQRTDSLQTTATLQTGKRKVPGPACLGRNDGAWSFSQPMPAPGRQRLSPQPGAESPGPVACSSLGPCLQGLCYLGKFPCFVAAQMGKRSMSTSPETC